MNYIVTRKRKDCQYETVKIILKYDIAHMKQEEGNISKCTFALHRYYIQKNIWNKTIIVH